jgi:hypothetical protein
MGDNGKRIGLNVCKVCGIDLPPTKERRTHRKMCWDCRGDHQSHNQALREIFKELQKRKPVVEEGVFEDDPRAVKELEYGRVIKRSNVTARETTLSEIII